MKDIENGLNNMLQTSGGKNGFETAPITISAAEDTVDHAGNVTNYGDRIKDVKSNILADITQLAKDNLFNENVLKECLG